MAVESFKTLRRRIKAVRSIKQITRAMEMVSASKLRRAQATLMAGRPYAAKLRELLRHLAAGDNVGEHPLFQVRGGGETQRKILALFTADRGLCGSFNINLIKTAEELIKSEPDTRWQLVCVGKKGRDHFANRGWEILDAVTTLHGQPNVGEARRIADLLLGQFVADRCDSILLVYPKFYSTVVHRPIWEQYLPLTPAALRPEDKGAEPDNPEENHWKFEYLFEPSAVAVFDSLLPRYLSSRIYMAMAECCTAENSARMVAMNNATRNCMDLNEHLTLKLNKARQWSITKELLDIVGGAEALR